MEPTCPLFAGRSWAFLKKAFHQTPERIITHQVLQTKILSFYTSVTYVLFNINAFFPKGITLPLTVLFCHIFYFLTILK
jgi:hypothetical protein